jgi:hypothetical protein
VRSVVNRHRRWIRPRELASQKYEMRTGYKTVSEAIQRVLLKAPEISVGTGERKRKSYYL